MPSTKYDWVPGREGYELDAFNWGQRGTPRMRVRVHGGEQLLRLYEAGYLTGNAEAWAKRVDEPTEGGNEA